MLLRADHFSLTLDWRGKRQGVFKLQILLGLDAGL
jgi:hypothetical protein